MELLASPVSQCPALAYPPARVPRSRLMNGLSPKGGGCRGRRRVGGWLDPSNMSGPLRLTHAASAARTQVPGRRCLPRGCMYVDGQRSTMPTYTRCGHCYSSEFQLVRKCVSFCGIAGYRKGGRQMMMMIYWHHLGNLASPLAAGTRRAPSCGAERKHSCYCSDLWYSA